MGYDYDCEDGTKVLTHASAFHHHSLFELVAGVDPDEQKRLLFTRKFGAPAFATVQDMYLLLTVEVVALAVPTYAHFEAFRQILPHRPTLLICEKPISYSMPEAEAVVEEAKKNGIDLVVNYIRRFDPGVVKLKELISSGSLGITL